jgi:hypothetical protein
MTNPHSKFAIGSRGGPGQVDDRKGRGYGSIDPQYHLPRQMGGGFPYTNTDEQDAYDEEIEGTDTGVSEETTGKMLRKAEEPWDFDEAGFGHDDPGHFADATTKVHEVVANSMVPFPGLYKTSIDNDDEGIKNSTTRRDGSTRMPKFKPKQQWERPSTVNYLHSEKYIDNYIDDGRNDDIFEPNDHELYLNEILLRRIIRQLIINQI